MKKILRIAAVLLITASVLFMIFSCNASTNSGNSGKNENSDKPANDSVNAVEENSPGGAVSPEEKDISFPRDVRDFGGYTFKVLIDTETANRLDIEGKIEKDINNLITQFENII